MNKGLLAQIINGMRMNQQQGSFGNVSTNEASMFSGNPMNGAVAGGNVGNVSNNEADIFNMMAGSNTGGGVSNAMPRINEMRNNLATAGSVGNASNKEAAMIQAVNEMRGLQAKGAAGNGVLTTDEINRFVYLRNIINPNLTQEKPVDYNTLPVDIDGASAGKAMSQEELNFILSRIR